MFNSFVCRFVRNAVVHNTRVALHICWLPVRVWRKHGFLIPLKCRQFQLTNQFIDTFISDSTSTKYVYECSQMVISQYMTWYWFTLYSLVFIFYKVINNSIIMLMLFRDIINKQSTIDQSLSYFRPLHNFCCRFTSNKYYLNELNEMYIIGNTLISSCNETTWIHIVMTNIHRL